MRRALLLASYSFSVLSTHPSALSRALSRTCRPLRHLCSRQSTPLAVRLAADSKANVKPRSNLLSQSRPLHLRASSK